MSHRNAASDRTSSLHHAYTIRSATAEDEDAVWQIVEGIIRASDVYTLPRDMKREDALSYWFSPAHRVFVTVDGQHILGTYYLRANQMGGGTHVANCGYATSVDARDRGVASAMCIHSLRKL